MHYSDDLRNALLPFFFPSPHFENFGIFDHFGVRSFFLSAISLFWAFLVIFLAAQAIFQNIEEGVNADLLGPEFSAGLFLQARLNLLTREFGTPHNSALVLRESKYT